MAEFSRAILDTPVGKVVAAASRQGLYALDFAERLSKSDGQRTLTSRIPTPQSGNGAADEILRRTDAWLTAYFAGDFARLVPVPMVFFGSEFEQCVWDAMCEIPIGTTYNYSQLALHVGRKDGARAVGTAVGHNPIAIIVPCHRVIGSNGTLTGYGGGLDKKVWLLRHEGFAVEGELKSSKVSVLRSLWESTEPAFIS